MASLARLLAVLLIGLSCAAASAAEQAAQTPEATRGLLRTSLAPAAGNVDLSQELHALLIGASRYRAGWNPLPGVQRDIEAVRARLQQSNFTDVVVVMDPDKAAIERAFAEMAARVRDNRAARVLVYYAGHGENLDGEGYLVPVDAPLPQVDGAGFRARAIALPWLRNQLRELPARHALVVLDNCFAGSIFSTMRGTPLYPPAIGYLVAQPSRQIVAAGTEEQTVPDESIFRRYFVSALAGAGDIDGDGYITGTEISMFLRSRVANDSRGRQTPLFARLEGKDFHKGEFVLLSPLSADAAPLIAEDNTPPPSPAPPLAQRGGGGSFRDCTESFCPNMVTLPRGKFVPGAPTGETGRSPLDWLPGAAPVPVAGFAISQHEITFDAWDACFRDGACTRWPDDMGWGRGGRPVINVSWQDAQQFTAWLSMKTGAHYRLPTEPEWEYAARAGMATARPWGEEIGENQANCAACGNDRNGQGTTPIGSFPANRFRLHDMLGNVWEWTDGCPQDPAPGTATASAPERECRERVLRGGAWSTDAKGVRSAVRSGFPAGRGSRSIGFRVVRDDTP